MNTLNSSQRESKQAILLDILRPLISETWLWDLICQVVHHNPREGAMYRSTNRLFDLVPPHKSLLHAPHERGLPIGNLTSQFFANVYMNELDQFAKHGLRAKYYGRYVDDIVMFDESAEVLNEHVELAKTLGISIEKLSKAIELIHKIGIKGSGILERELNLSSDDAERVYIKVKKMREYK